MKIIFLFPIFALTLCNIFNGNLNLFLKQNAPFEVYEPDENPFKDYTYEELQGLFIPEYFEENGFRDQINEEEDEEEEDKYNKYPKSYDFRVNWKDCAAPIKNQQKCGSCWAFAGSTSLAMRFCVASKGAINVVLSPQDSISCDDGNWGCDGGNREYTWDYYKTTGIVSETCFPYSSGKGDVEECVSKCKNGEEWKKYKVKDYQTIYGVNDIKNQLLTEGPVHTGFTVFEDFMQYKSGIYQYTSGKYLGGHSVVIIGWGIENGIKYWIVQNSWGENWGENGYFRIKMKELSIDKNPVVGTPLI